MFHSNEKEIAPLRETFKVLVRINPTLSSCWKIEASQMHNRKHHFTHKQLYYREDNQSIYNSQVKSVVEAAMRGYNSTLFAYGTTASGKSHTMFGNPNELGFISLALDTIFDSTQSSNKEYLIRMSFIELYNEQIRDLLSETGQRLKILENKVRGPFVWPLNEVVIESKEQCIALIEEGLIKRRSATTDYNLHSSRSHAIVQFLIESRSKNQSLLSTLNIIDLAGSEKASSGRERRLESRYINTSLLSLSKVISALLQDKRDHIPFRDSKLTRILQSSLTGNACCTVVCCINPSEHALEESINTLHFSTKLQQMCVNVDLHPVQNTLLQKYKAEIENLKAQIAIPTRSASLQQEHDKLKEMFEQQQQVKERLQERIEQLTRFILSSKSEKKKTQRPISMLEGPLPVEMDTRFRLDRRVRLEGFVQRQLYLEEMTSLHSKIERSI